MRPRDRGRANQYETGLIRFDRERRALAGIREQARRESFVEQLLESDHRVEYLTVIRRRPLSPRRMDPADALFDPLRAAMLQYEQGNTDEAFWLVFLATHFGKHRRAGWRYAREVYGRLGHEQRWDWANVSADTRGFRAWLHEHRDALRGAGESRGGFGNHRKRESLDAYASRGTGAAVESYVAWVNPPRSHSEVVNEALRAASGDAKEAFDRLYQSMAVVRGFGRTGRFDYLTMLSKLGFVPIQPGLAYLKGSTGPVMGAKLLFADDAKARIKIPDLEQWLVELGAELGTGMNVLEDALCNWQKSPNRFRPFRG